jgi:hypothetical protein
MSQTNAPAGSDWVDQFNRATQYGQISSSALGGVSGTGIVDIVVLSQAAYNALAVKSSTTLYIIA